MKRKKEAVGSVISPITIDFVINDPHYEVAIEVAQCFLFSSANDENCYLSLAVSKRTINRHLMGACKLQGKISNKYNYTYY